MRKADALPVLRPWNDAWQLWQPAKKGAGSTLARTIASGDRAVAESVCCAIPARRVLAVPFWVEAEDESTAREIALLEVEMKGLAAGERLAVDVEIRILRREGGQVLILALVFPGDELRDVPGTKLRRFVPSPLVAVLGGTMVHLWQEFDDLVAVVVWKDQVVCWETLTARSQQHEVRAWLECLLIQLTGELRIESPFLLKEWRPVFDEAPGFFTREPILSEEDRAAGPTLLAQPVPCGWMPAIQRSAHEAGRRQRTMIRTGAAVLGVLVILVLVGVGLSLRLDHRIQAVEKQTATLEQEIAPLRDIATRWNTVEASVDERFHPLEILRGIVGAMPASGIRLTVFEMSPERVLVEGEADNVSSASDFLKAVAAVEESGLVWEMPPPSLQPNNTARFALTGVQEGGGEK